MADIPESTNSVPSSDLADILVTIQNASDDWQKQGYPTALAEVRDMANVGRALMTAIADNADSPPLKGWHPADCPSEIVSDLLNMLDDATRAAPPAMDREAVADIIAANVSGPNLRMLGIDPTLHREDQLRAADLILSTLSADAIRQGEVVTTANFAVVGSDLWRHVKRGTVYEVIGTAELQAGQPQLEHAELVIYRGEDGKLWARNSAEFHDGRFVPASHASDGGKA